MIGVSRLASFAVAKRSSGEARTKKGGAPATRARHASSAISGPIPAGSPIVIARGGLSPVMNALRPLRVRPSKADVPLDVADGAQSELEHQRLLAHGRIEDDGSAGEDRVGRRGAEGRRILQGKGGAVILVAEP